VSTTNDKIKRLSRLKSRRREVASKSSGKRTAPPTNSVADFLRNKIISLVSSERRGGAGIESASDAGEPPLPTAKTPTGYSAFAPANLEGEPPQDALTGGEPRPVPRWKRLLDVSCVLLTSPLWLPLMLFAMLWVKIFSPGPVFYRQQRIGYRGRGFMIFKLRTMHINVDTKTHESYFERLMMTDCPMTKLDSSGDSRLIRCGRVLRATGLDELPQIFNVLRGEMSLVGPRPCLPPEFERYQAWQKQRVNALPGLTGYWQVNGKNKTTFGEMVTMDIFYTNNVSLRLDLRIMLRTLPVLMSQTLETVRLRFSHRPEQFPFQTPQMTKRMNGTVKEI
jgi:lipopolysaccharide/colanic/teichoic acid biosynthesis glycosyltransferase